MRGPDVASLAGLRAVRGVWLYGGLPRPSVTVCGSGVDAAGGLVQPLVVRVSSSVDRVSVWTVRAVAVGDDGRERDGMWWSARGLAGAEVWCAWAGWTGWAAVRGAWARVEWWPGVCVAVELWGVSVVTSSVVWLPPAMRLPAVDVGVDVGALSWGEPVTIDTAGRSLAAECGCAGR